MILWIIAGASLVGAIIVIWAFFHPGYGDVPMTPAPTESPSQAPSVTPTLPTTPSPSPTPTIPAMENIDGMPVHIRITHGSTALVDTAIVVTLLDGNGMLVPPAGQAGVYYSPEQWSTLPGNLDTYRGIIVGHNVTGSGVKDVFYDLGQVKQGDVVTITYQLNAGGVMTAEFVVTADAHSAPKTDVIQAPEYQYLWQPTSEPGRYLSIFSCDLSQAEPGQHSRNNWIVDTIRTK